MSICSCLWLCNCLWLCSRLCYDYVDDIYFIYCHWKESEFLLHHMSTCMRTVQKVMDLNFPHEKKIKHMRYLLEGRCMAPSSGMCKFSPTCKKHQSLVVSLHCQRAVESYQIFICHKITQLLEQQYCIRFYLKLCDAQSETIWQIQQTSVGNVISIMWLGSATITWKMTKHRLGSGPCCNEPYTSQKDKVMQNSCPRPCRWVGDRHWFSTSPFWVRIWPCKWCLGNSSWSC